MPEHIKAVTGEAQILITPLVVIPFGIQFWLSWRPQTSSAKAQL